MPAAPFWDDDPSSHQTVTLGGVTLPGLCFVEDIVSAGPRWDSKEAPGADGATDTFKGYSPGSLTIRVVLWTAEHFATWQRILPQIAPPPGKDPPQPLDIISPLANAAGIKAVRINGGIRGVNISDDGRGEATIPCREFIKPKPKNVTKTATGSAASGPQVNRDGDNFRENASTPTLPSLLRPTPSNGADENTTVSVIGDAL